MSFEYLKKSALVISICSALLATPSTAAAQDNSSVLISGMVVTQQMLSKTRAEDYFKVSEIPDEVWEFMQNRTYKDNPYIKRGDLRYVKVLHIDFNNDTKVGEIICNKAIADDIRDIFLELYKNSYQIGKIVLPDYYNADDEMQMRDNNTSAFCYREVKGTSTLSKHARGLAIDINTYFNPYCRIKKDGELFVQPATAADYCNREKGFSHKIDKNDLAYKLFTKKGFTWGGDWQSLKDYQHFEIEKE